MSKSRYYAFVCKTLLSLAAPNINKSTAACHHVTPNKLESRTVGERWLSLARHSTRDDDLSVKFQKRLLLDASRGNLSATACHHVLQTYLSPVLRESVHTHLAALHKVRCSFCQASRKSCFYQRRAATFGNPTPRSKSGGSPSTLKRCNKLQHKRRRAVSQSMHSEPLASSSATARMHTELKSSCFQVGTALLHMRWTECAVLVAMYSTSE